MAETTDIVCGGADILRVIQFVSMLLDIILFLVPIGLIVMVSVDFLKNVIANNQEDMAKNAKLAVKRILNCIALFLVSPIVSFTITLIGDTGMNALTCIDIAKNDDLSLYEIDFVDESYDVKNVTFSAPSGLTPATSATIKGSNANVQAFLNAMNKISRQVEKDANDKDDKNKWKYSNANTKDTFNIANKTTKQTNCALYVVWGLIDVGILEKGDRFYKCYDSCGNTNKINYKNTSEKELKKYLKFIDGNGEKASTLISNGTLQAGDIVLWFNHQHTNVYAGDKKWYDAGRQAKVNGSGPNDNFRFTTLGPVKLSGWNNEKVWKILRIK